MRFFSSSALASAPKLRLAASCSAAETIGPGPFPRHGPACHRPVPSCRQLAVKDADARNKPGMTTSLRRFLFCAVILCRRQDLYGAASLLDRRDGRFRRAANLDRDLGLDLAA